MQTFLPYPDFRKSAMCLDYRRLGKQRIEARQLLHSLFFGGGWVRHPASKMWKGYELALATYGLTVCNVWRERGYQDNTGIYFNEFLHANSEHEVVMPSWLGDRKFHASHQSNLLRKFPEHYSQFNWPVHAHLPYVWPV